MKQIVSTGGIAYLVVINIDPQKLGECGPVRRAIRRAIEAGESKRGVFATALGGGVRVTRVERENSAGKEGRE